MTHASDDDEVKQTPSLVILLERRVKTLTADLKGGSTRAPSHARDALIICRDASKSNPTGREYTTNADDTAGVVDMPRTLGVSVECPAATNWGRQSRASITPEKN